jgi:hypothetical protein
LSIQTFSKPFLFSNNKEKLKTTGPLPHLACADRAKGGRRLSSGLRPKPFWPSLAGQRSHATAARPCGPTGQRPESREGAPPTGAHRWRAVPVARGDASVHTTPSRTGWEGDVGPAARRTTRPRQCARRRGRRHQARPLPR